MEIPKLNEVKLDEDDFLSEQEYDRYVVDIVAHVIGKQVKIKYARGENYVYPSKTNEYTIVKAKPKLKGIDGNSALYHESYHLLYGSFDPRAEKTVKDWSREWKHLERYAYQTYHEAMNILEDQRIESLGGKTHLGVVRGLITTRKNIGKNLQYIDHPSAVLLAERCYRSDLVSPSKYSFLAQFVHDVEFKDIKATMVVMNKIKPYLDEKIKADIQRDNEIRDLTTKGNTMRNEMRTLPHEEAVKKQKEFDDLNDKVSDMLLEKKKEEEVMNADPRQNIAVDIADADDCKPYEFGDYETELKEQAVLGEKKIQEVRQLMEGSDTPIKSARMTECAVRKGNHPANIVVNQKTVKGISNLLRSFREKTIEEVSEDGYDLDIGEYINMKAQGHGDCFIEDTDTNGLSVVVSIDASGSMTEHNPLIVNMVSTIWEATKSEKNINMKCVTWYSTKSGELRYTNLSPKDIAHLQHQGGGYTPTHFGIEIGSNELRKMNGKRKLLIVITDGYPNYHINGVRVRADAVAKNTIKAYKKAIKNTPNIVIIGVGYGFHSSMKEMFGNRYISCKNISEVEGFVMNNLRKEIIRVMKR